MNAPTCSACREEIRDRRRALVTISLTAPSGVVTAVEGPFHLTCARALPRVASAQVVSILEYSFDPFHVALVEAQR